MNLEYSRFTYPEYVKAMVEDDHEAICQRFFRDPCPLVIDYQKDFFSVFDAYKDAACYIAPCMILQWDQNEEKKVTHSVLLIKENEEYFLYDSGGKISDGDRYLYFHDNVIYTSRDLRKFLKKEKGISIRFPKEKGVDWRCDSSITGYIHGGGYCMFFVREAINYITQKRAWGESLIHSAKQLTKEDIFTLPGGPLTYDHGVHENADKLFVKHMS